MDDSPEREGTPPGVPRRGQSERRLEPAPDALFIGIGWGLAFVVLGFWLPLALLVTRSFQVA